MRPILSICLPTYNRSVYLKRILDKIIKETAGIEFKIEINISNNGSIDDTDKIVKDFIKVHQKNLIKYRRNKKNLGYDKNLIATLKMADGKYCWFVGDDDDFVSGSIKRLLRILEKSDYDYFILNVEKNKRKFFKLNPNYAALSFMGCHIIKRLQFKKIEKYLPKNNFGFMHYSIYYTSLKLGCSLKILQDPYINIKADGTLLSAIPLVKILYNLLHITKELLKEKIISEKKYEEILNELYAKRSKYYVGSVLISKNQNGLRECYKIINEINSKYFEKNENCDKIFCLTKILFKNKFLLSVGKMMFRIYIHLMNILFSSKLILDEKSKARETNF